MENNKGYNRHEIKRGWNHVLAPIIRELKLDPVQTECLQGICKFNGSLLFYKGRNTGFPDSLKPQLGYVPSKAQIVASLKHLQNLGYIRYMGTTVDKDVKTKRTVHFQKDEMKIKRDASSIGNSSMGLFSDL